MAYGIDDLLRSGRIDRRAFLKIAGVSIGAGVLASCREADQPATGNGGQQTHPPIEQEPGDLRVFDWGGYGDGSYYPDKEKVFFWEQYQKATGDTPKFVLFEDDDFGYAKAASGAVDFDVVHPCVYRFQDWVNLENLQPWDTSLIPNFSSLNPTLQKTGNFGGDQYFIVADWGFAAPMYRADKVQPEEDSWSILWDERYAGKISWWDSLNMLVVAGYANGVADPWKMTDDELAQQRDFLVERKDLVGFFWGQSAELARAFNQDEIYIGYAWPDAYGIVAGEGLDVAYMQPKEGRTSWICGFGLSKDTENYHHAHEYVNSWTSTAAAEFMLNYYYYGHTNTELDLDKITPAIVEAFSLDDPNVLEEPNTHPERWIERRDVYSEYWNEVKAS